MTRRFAAFAAPLAALVLVPGLIPGLARAAPPAGDLMEKPKPSGGPPADTVFIFVNTMGPDDDLAQGYIERPKAPPVDGRITLWTATVPPADKPVAGHKGFIMLERMSFDCERRMNRWSGGVILDSEDRLLETDEQHDWKAVGPGSVNENALKLACGEVPPPAETVTGVPAVRADAERRFAQP